MRLVIGVLVVQFCGILALHAGEGIPRRVPARRSTQLAAGFGMNQSLPREPRLPWSRPWWTRLFDSGVKWVRIGQYENSSDMTSWDWVEQTPGHYAVIPELDEAVRSLVENGVEIEIQLQYSNPLYQGDPLTRPRRVLLPPPGIGQDDEPVNPIFIPPQTDDQIEAFLQYVRFMVNHFKQQVRYWELWNEPNIGYWRPHAKTKEELIAKARGYGKVLCRFADAVHGTNPEAKVISGGLAGPDLVFAQTALASCPEKVDVIAYHTYPGFGHNHMPEEADSVEGASVFRETLMHLPGMKNRTEFWNNEWNVSPKWEGSNDSVQARYVPRFYLYHLAQGVRGAMWTFVPSTDGNEDDFYGILHGDTKGPDAFQPRPSFDAFQTTSALFGQTVLDRLAEFDLRHIPEQLTHGALQAHAFRDIVSGKRIYAFWLAVLADSHDSFNPLGVDFEVKDSAIRNPILIDVRTGAVSPLEWASPGVLHVPLKDSVMAVADISYLDWPEVPETPAELRATRSGHLVNLQWKSYGDINGTEIQRSIAFGPWVEVGRTWPSKNEFADSVPADRRATYRVRALSGNGSSAWSNPAWVDVNR
ncbi:MAG: hypothetical protein ACE145_16655 [Terriglobia bacterium]